MFWQKGLASAFAYKLDVHTPIIVHILKILTCQRALFKIFNLTLALLASFRYIIRQELELHEINLNLLGSARALPTNLEHKID